MGIFIGNREIVFSSPAVHGLDCNELPSGISYVANATNAPNDSNDYFLVQTILSSGGGMLFNWPVRLLKMSYTCVAKSITLIKRGVNYLGLKTVKL